MGPLWVLSIFFSLTDSLEITAAKGKYVHLPCKPPTFDDAESFDVKWTKLGLEKAFCDYILNLTVKTRYCASHFQPSLEGLNISDFKNTHSGSYSCLITRTIPPPTLELYNTTIELHAVGLELEQVNTRDPGCVKLLCSIGITGQEQVHFIWNVRGGNQSKNGTISDSSFTASSSLRLCQTEWSSGDIITCSIEQSSGILTSKLYIEGHSSFDQNTGEEGSNNRLVIIICIGAVTGTALIVTIAVIIYKCKKRSDDASIVYTNKVYENFSFATGIPNRQSTRETTATQHENCVYEN